MKRLLPLGLLALVFLSGVHQVHGQGWPSPEEVRAMLVEAAERHGASAQQLLAVVGCETGGTYRVDLVGRLGERGAGQWLPGEGNAWRLTSHARQGVQIVDLYRRGDPDAPWLDLDGLAEVYATQPEAVLRREWSCYR